MSKINIRGIKEINDFSYRYKMEEVNIVNQGAQKAWLNIDVISSVLFRSSSDIVKFLKKYFGSSFDYKNGIMTTFKKDLTKQMLQEAVFQYIEQFVLCKKCKNPETENKQIKKKHLIVCKACGYSYEE
jgi:translation initiation factor 5